MRVISISHLTLSNKTNKHLHFHRPVVVVIVHGAVKIIFIPNFPFMADNVYSSEINTKLVLIKHINISYSSVCDCHLHSTDALRPSGKYTNNSGGLAPTPHEKLYLPLPEQHGC